MTDVVWPRGYPAFYKKISSHADKILTGTLLAIDPSSGSKDSMPGFAIFYAGELQTSGTVDFPVNKVPVYDRLQHLYDKVSTLLPVPPDVFAIEEINSNPRFSHQYLQWAIGVSIAAARSPVTFEVPINAWKSLAKVTPDYGKDDASDAVMIGRTLIELAKR